MAGVDAFAALRQAGYRRFLTSSLLAGLGSQMVSVAVGWELYERTGSALALGYVGLVQFLPSVLFALPSGHLADRFPRQKILLVGCAGMLAAALGLAWISWRGADVRWVYVCLFVMGTVRTLWMAAGASLLPLLVPVTVFANAVMWRSSMFQLASMVGPALGGWLIAVQERAVGVYLTQAILTVGQALCLAGLRPRRSEVGTESLTWESLVAGFRFVWETKLIFAALTLDMCAVLLGGATALLPVYAKDLLAVGPSGLGWLRAMPAVGALTMGMFLAFRPPLERAGWTLLLAVAGFGAATVVFGLSRSFGLSLAMLFVVGALDNISVVVRHTLVQMATPDRLRGRVSAVNGLFITCSNEISSFRAGAFAAWWGPVAAVVSGGLGTIAVVVAVAVVWPVVRQLRRLPGVAPAVPEEEEQARSGP